MRKLKCFLSLLSLVIGLCFPCISLAEEKLAVMDLKPMHGIQESLAKALSVEVRNTIRGQGEYEVLSKEDLASIAERTRMRQMLGCDDTQCLIDFGQAIGTKYMVAGSISKLGKTYSIDLRLIDTEGADAGVKNRGSKKCKCTEDELFGTARTVAAVLMGKEPQVKASAVSLEAPKKIITGRLFVKTKPEKARTRILNIKPRFYDGIELAPGRYHVEVSTPGYETKKKWIDLGEGEDRHIEMRLEKFRVAEPAATTGKTFTNSLGIRFVLIPAGSFMMGSPPGEPGRDDDEDQHQVTLTHGFYLASTEVTQGQWQTIMGNNPSHFKHCGNDCPVETVSWKDCQEFIKRLNQREKAGKYRLPTEAEWEYACRAGSKTELYTGPMKVLGDNNAPALDDIAWYGGNSCAKYEGTFDCSGWSEKQYPCAHCGTHAVAGKKPNAWGLYDMLGNVWEWCQDWYEEYGAGPLTDPKGPASGEDRVLRGGGWDGFAVGCRAATRDSEAPDYGDYLMGFRLAKTP